MDCLTDINKIGVPLRILEKSLNTAAQTKNTSPKASKRVRTDASDISTGRSRRYTQQVGRSAKVT